MHQRNVQKRNLNPKKNLTIQYKFQQKKNTHIKPNYSVHTIQNYTK
jgi:hypothetical protein